ncbi:hypothetical protein, partial [Enterococcus durans]
PDENSSSYFCLAGLIIVDASVETPIIWEDTGTEQIGIVDQTKIVPHIFVWWGLLSIVDASVETPIIGEDTGTEQIGIVGQTKIVPHSLRNRGFVQRVVSWILIIRNMKKTIGFRAKKTVVFSCFFQM